MKIELNHTIIPVPDAQLSANFLTEILGLPDPIAFGSFIVVKTTNEVSLDFTTTTKQIPPRHYAFLVDDVGFDNIFKRISDKNIAYWADPRKEKAHQINHNDGGRGFYFNEPGGHFLEVLTKPYGSETSKDG